MLSPGDSAAAVLRSTAFDEDSSGSNLSRDDIDLATARRLWMSLARLTGKRIKRSHDDVTVVSKVINTITNMDLQRLQDQWKSRIECGICGRQCNSDMEVMSHTLMKHLGSLPKVQRWNGTVTMRPNPNGTDGERYLNAFILCYDKPNHRHDEEGDEWEDGQYEVALSDYQKVKRLRKYRITPALVNVNDQVKSKSTRGTEALKSSSGGTVDARGCNAASFPPPIAQSSPTALDDGNVSVKRKTGLDLKTAAESILTESRIGNLPPTVKPKSAGKYKKVQSLKKDRINPASVNINDQVKLKSTRRTEALKSSNGGTVDARGCNAASYHPPFAQSSPTTDVGNATVKRKTDLDLKTAAESMLTGRRIDGVLHTVIGKVYCPLQQSKPALSVMDWSKGRYLALKGVCVGSSDKRSLMGYSIGVRRAVGGVTMHAATK